MYLVIVEHNRIIEEYLLEHFFLNRAGIIFWIRKIERCHDIDSMLMDDDYFLVSAGWSTVQPTSLVSEAEDKRVIS